MEPDRPVPFGYKCAWLAIRTVEPELVVSSLDLINVRRSNWQKGIAAGYDGDVFVTPVIQGWVLVVSFSLPEIEDSAQRDELTTLVESLATKFPEVQYFGTHRVVEYHGWLRAKNGRIVRRYGYLGERGRILRDDGERTEEETRLGLVFSDSKWPREEAVMRIAGAWSINPTTLDELNLGEGVGYLGSFSKK